MNHNEGKPWDNPTERRRERGMIVTAAIVIGFAVLFLICVLKTYGQAPARLGGIDGGSEKNYGSGDSIGSTIINTYLGNLQQQQTYNHGYSDGMRAALGYSGYQTYNGQSAAVGGFAATANGGMVYRVFME